MIAFYTAVAVIGSYFLTCVYLTFCSERTREKWEPWITALDHSIYETNKIAWRTLPLVLLAVTTGCWLRWL